MTRTYHQANDERRVLGEHPDGGWIVSSSDGIGEHHTWLDGRVIRCSCPSYTYRGYCPHLWPTAVHIGMANEERQNEAAYAYDRALIDALPPIPSKPGKRLEELYD